MIVQSCDQAKVKGTTTAASVIGKWTVDITVNRPTTGLEAGLSVHFDTTLGKSI